MLIYEGIDDLEEIDFDKTDKSKECMICHYWFFKDKTLILRNVSVMVVN